MSLEPHGELVPVGGGDPISLIRAVMTVGRRESCDVRLNFPNVSGVHCELTFREGYWYLRDMNSTNGTKVNGARVQEKLLHPNDKLTIGKKVYMIHYELPAGRRAAEELEEDILSKSLLERAGLEKPKPGRGTPRGRDFDPAEHLLTDDD